MELTNFMQLKPFLRSAHSNIAIFGNVEHTCRGKISGSIIFNTLFLELDVMGRTGGSRLDKWGTDKITF